MNKRDIEEPLFLEENEKYYYNYLKIFFLKENFYDIFIKNYYFKFLNYSDFTEKLKNKVFIKKYRNISKKIIFKKNFFFFNFNNNIIKIKNEILNNNFFNK